MFFSPWVSLECKGCGFLAMVKPLDIQTPKKPRRIISGFRWFGCLTDFGRQALDRCFRSQLNGKEHQGTHGTLAVRNSQVGLRLGMIRWIPWCLCRIMGDCLIDNIMVVYMADISIDNGNTSFGWHMLICLNTWLYDCHRKNTKD